MNNIKIRTDQDFSSDDEKFEDASSSNEQIIEELLKNTSNLEIEVDSDDNNKTSKNMVNEEIFTDCDSDDIDDESQKDLEKVLSDEEKLVNKEKSEVLKNEGNELFKSGEYEKSIELYTSGLKMCPVDCSKERSILYANRAAAKTKLDFKNPAIEDCSKAIEFNSNYLKPLLRRAKLYEETDKLDESLEDYKKILELDQSVIEAKQALIRLPPKINERNEKMKDEMIGKLKDLGNTLLKPFGLSTSNFQMQQDPKSGSYSINFNQNSKQ